MRNFLKGIAFLSPWIIGFIAFTAIPIGLSLYYSFCDYSLLQPPMYRGLENYRTMFTDEVFWKALKVTGYYAAVALPMGMVISLSLALLLNLKVRGLSIYRTMIFLPSLVPAVASAMLWLWLFNPKLGLINAALLRVLKPFVWLQFRLSNHKLGWISVALLSLSKVKPPAWLGSPVWAMPALILMSFWGVGNTVIIYLAGLQDVPRELYEAADLDGASGWGKILHVTIPAISPVIFFNLIMAIIGSVQSFTTPFIMTPDGGPDRSTLFYTMRLYSQAFEYLKMGEASAMAWVQLLIVLGLTAIAFWTSKRWVYYQGK